MLDRVSSFFLVEIDESLVERERAAGAVVGIIQVIFIAVHG